MLKTTFPGTQLETSVISLGLGGYGASIAKDESLRLLDIYAEAGGNFADTAHIYAAWIPNGWGASERLLGEWLRTRRPKGFIVGTKGGHPDMGSPLKACLAPKELRSDLTESLDRLGQDSVDLYWLHRDDPAVPVGEVMGTLQEFVTAGRVRYLGASNWTTERITAANAWAAKNGATPFCASQVSWSLADGRPELQGHLNMLYLDDTMRDWHIRSGMPVVAYGSQAQGLFAGPWPGGGFTEPTPKQKALTGTYAATMDQTIRNAGRFQRAGKLATQLGRTANEVALAYVWSQNFPGVAIVGSRTEAQLRETLKAGDFKLSAEQVAYLRG